MNRRQFLTKSGLTIASLILQPPSLGLAVTPTRALSLYNTHTREKLDITYSWSRQYNQEALGEINHFLRDFRTGEVHPIDPHLLDILHSIRETFGNQGTFEIISGYRSPKTNKQLRNNSTAVAKRSLHMQGKAIDLRLSGINTKKLQQCALQMQCGGVGYYPKSDFVHLDTGRVRFW